MSKLVCLRIDLLFELEVVSPQLRHSLQELLHVVGHLVETGNTGIR